MQKWRLSLLALLSSALLAACGGGGGGAPAASTPVPPDAQGPGAPTLTGNNATDGYNWINYRRGQLGLSILSRNSLIDTAAQGHSDYQRLNRVITHEQTAGQPGFTGVRLQDRLQAAGYQLTGGWAAGEVISATTNTTGFTQAEELITAIYHRFVIFEPVFREVGVGSATVSGGYTYFTADFAVVNGYNGLGAGKFVTYPYNSQTGVPVNFFSDTESPDPVPEQNEVGYPVSVHADQGRVVSVQSFSIAPHGGAALSTRLLTAGVGTLQATSTAAIVPLLPLRSGTTYDVSFSGAVDGAAVTRNWSFTTK